MYVPPQPHVEGKPVSWYVQTVSTTDIPLWRWDDIDAGDWHLIATVKAAFDEGVAEAKAERGIGQQHKAASR